LAAIEAGRFDAREHRIPATGHRVRQDNKSRGLRTIVLLVLLYIAIFLVEGPALLRARAWRDFVFFCIFLLLGIVASMLPAAGVKLPSPSNFLTHLFDPLANLVLGPP
jgi:hypothetical protein